MEDAKKRIKRVRSRLVSSSLNSSSSSSFSNDLQRNEGIEVVIIDAVRTPICKARRVLTVIGG